MNSLVRAPQVRALLGATCFVLVAGAAVPVGAATITVDSTDDAFATDGDCTLREAVYAANNNVATDGCAAGEASPIRDVVEVPFLLSSYALSLAGLEDAGLTGDLDLEDDVEIRGVPSGDLVPLISESVGDRIFDVLAGVTAIVSGLELRDGSGTEGGCIRVAAGATLVLRDATLRLCSASDRGGAISSVFGVVTIERSTIIDNTATLEGGGVSLSNSTGTISNSALVHNIALTSGGGLFGGGAGTSAIVRNSTLSANVAVKFGGGIYWTDGSLHLRNVTIAMNEADTGGGSVDGGGGVVNAGAVVNLRNTIVAGNTDQGNDPDCAGTLTSEGYNLIGADSASCTIAGDLTGVQTDLDAMLDDLVVDGSTRVHPLLTGSPAIDAGSPAAIPLVPRLAEPGVGPPPCEARDQRGLARPFDGDEIGGARCDPGAYELFPGPFADGFEQGSTARWSATSG